MIETPQASGGGEWLGVSPPQGGVSPPQPTRGSGERRKLPLRGSGRSPGDLEIFLHFDALRWSLMFLF